MTSQLYCFQIFCSRRGELLARYLLIFPYFFIPNLLYSSRAKPNSDCDGFIVYQMENIQKTGHSQKPLHKAIQLYKPRLSTREQQYSDENISQKKVEISVLSIHPDIQFSESITNKDSQEQTAKYCRICLEGEISGSRLLSPCNCTNCVHDTCLLDWLNHRQELGNKIAQKCEICLQKYDVEIEQNYCLTFEVCKSENRSHMPSLIVHLLIFLLLLTIIALTIVFFFKLSSSNEFVSSVQNIVNLPLNTLMSLAVIVIVVSFVFAIFWGCRTLHRYCYGVAMVLREANSL